MPVSDKDARVLFQKSGNRCAFPGCGKLLTYVDQGAGSESELAVSDIAHMVGESVDGPRGRYPLALDDRNKVDNLVLFCKEHHRVVDTLVPTYPVERLRAIKEEHERQIEAATAQATRSASSEALRYEEERLFSTLLPVLRMPPYVYSAPCEGKTERDLKDLIARPRDEAVMAPFILRGGRLYCFNNLRRADNPFARIVDGKMSTAHRSVSWWTREETLAWFVSLLNRSLNKLTGRKGLMLDKDHHRYYFQPNGEPGSAEPKKVLYTPLNISRSERSAVWQPVQKRTGKQRPYWFHLAAALRFHLVGRRAWVLSLRPELRVTKDGFMPIASRNIGSKVTRRKARSFNNDLLEEIQFWRSFLSDGKPRVVFQFGHGQQIIVSSSMMEQQIWWPGMPEEYRLQFRNVDFDEDLFSLAEQGQLDGEYEEELDEEAYEEEHEL